MPKNNYFNYIIIRYDQLIYDQLIELILCLNMFIVKVILKQFISFRLSKK